jgi:CheY-like chemotaxis protein
LEGNKKGAVTTGTLLYWSLTANVMKGDREKVLETGMNDYIAKPIKPDEMFTTMAKWIKPKSLS